MSKIIGSDGNAKAWALPEISDMSKPVNGDAPLTAREIKAVEDEICRIKEQAYQEGFNKGQQDGLASGQQQADKTIQSITTILEALSTPLKYVDEKLEDELVNLAVSIAKQIVRRELKTDPAQIVGVVKESLSFIPSSAQNIRVYLNPEDAEIVRKIMPVNAGERSWNIIDDPVLSRGSCNVETDATVVDATFESRIATIAAEIMGSERSND